MVQKRVYTREASILKQITKKQHGRCYAVFLYAGMIEMRQAAWDIGTVFNVHTVFIWKSYNINCKNDAFSLANTVVKLDFTVYYI